MFNYKYLYFKVMFFVLLKGKKLQLQYLITKLTYSVRNSIVFLGVFATVKGWHFVIVVLQNNVSTFLAFEISMYIEESGWYSRAQVFWERCYKCQIRQYVCVRYMISQSMWSVYETLGIHMMQTWRDFMMQILKPGFHILAGWWL